MIKQLQSDLNAIDTTDCANNVDTIKAALASIKTEHQNIKAARSANKDYFVNTLQPALKDLRSQIKALKKK